MDSKKYIGMDVHKESISIAVRNAAGKICSGSGDCVGGGRHRPEKENGLTPMERLRSFVDRAEPRRN
jgi:hypothetical protein